MSVKLFFLSDAYPCHVAFTNSYVNVTGFMVALTDMGQALSMCTSVWASAVLLDFVGPQAVLIQFWIGVLISLVMTLSVYILGRTKKHVKVSNQTRKMYLMRTLNSVQFLLDKFSFK